MKNEATAVFGLDCHEQQDVAEVTRLLGMEPSRVVVSGIIDCSAPTGRIEFHTWQLESPLPKSANVNLHVERLIEILSPHADTIRAFTDRLDGSLGGSIHCIVTYHRPPCPAEICVWKPSVQALAKMGLAISFDVFFEPDPGWEEDPPIECY